MAMSREKKLANEHWKWVSGLLFMFTPPEIVEKRNELLEYLYKTAFMHGYKHGQEDEKE